MEENKKENQVELIGVPEDVLGRLIRGNNMNYYRKGFMDGYVSTAVGIAIGVAVVGSVTLAGKVVKKLIDRKEESNGDKNNV